MPFLINYRIFLASLDANSSRVRKPRRIARTLQVLALEDRVVPDGAAFSPYVAYPLGGTGSPDGQGSFGGAFAPSDIQAAYGISQLIANGTNGAGKTVAIIDAYDDPSFVSDTSSSFSTSDLAYFDADMGLPNPPSFKKYNQTGGTSYPAVDPSSASSSDDWEGEEALDVEWVHSIAPGANIMLVEANSNYFSDLFAAADWAAGHGADAVTMSFGANGGFGSEFLYDSTFSPTTYSHVTFIASSGDSGSMNPDTGTDGNGSGATGQAGYPADSPNVLAAGGTSLNVVGNGNFNYASESVWNNGATSPGVYQSTGGGVSNFESQSGQSTAEMAAEAAFSTTNRTTPDVSFLADPYTGVAVYDSFNGHQAHGGYNNYYTFGGTSLSSPSWAGLIAEADQIRGNDSQPSLTGATDTLPRLYSIYANAGQYAADFHDVNSGSNGTFSAGTGYDLSSGIGSPIANTLLPDLSGVVTTSVVVDGSGDLVVTDAASGGQADALTIKLVNGANGPSIRVTDPNNILSNGTHTVDTPIALITGNIQVNTLAGNDSLTVDYSGGTIPYAILYNGGAGTNTLTLKGDTAGTVTESDTGSAAGSIATASEGTVTYSNVQTVSDTNVYANLVLNLPSVATNIVTLADDGTSGNGLSSISGSTIPTTVFANPTSLLTIDRGTAADSVALNALPDFTAGLTIGAVGSEFSAVTFNGALTLASGNSLSANATGSIALSTATSNLAASGTGAITLTAAQNITLASGSSIITASGAATLDADSGGTGAGTITLSGTAAIFGAAINLRAEDVSIAGTATVGSTSGGNSTVTITPSVTSEAIDLGTNTAGTLGLTDAELDQVTAGILAIGSASSGPITVSQDLTRPTTTQLTLHSGSSILISGGQVNTDGGTLILQPGSAGSIQPVKAGTDATASNLDFAVGANLSLALNGTTADSQYTQLNAAAAVNLMNAGLVLSGSYVPAPGNTFTLVSATSLTNTFNNLPDGTQIPFNGRMLTIHYTATSVTLSIASTAPTLSSVSINAVNPETGLADAAYAAQRSRVTSVLVNFAGPVTAANFTSQYAITFTRTESASTSNGPTTQVISSTASAAGADLVNVAQDGTNGILLTFSIIGSNTFDNAIEYGSLSDGGWQMTIANLNGGTYATPDWHTTGTASGGTAPYTGLYRLFGDTNAGANVIAGGDGAALNATFGTTYNSNNLSNGYNAALDWDGDGTILAGTDKAEFNARFGTTLT